MMPIVKICLQPCHNINYLYWVIHFGHHAPFSGCDSLKLAWVAWTTWLYRLTIWRTVKAVTWETSVGGGRGGGVGVLITLMSCQHQQQQRHSIISTVGKGQLTWWQLFMILDYLHLLWYKIINSLTLMNHDDHVMFQSNKYDLEIGQWYFV